ncbi:MAG: hypothetical protein MK132_14795 [Lentisphaerales bacterium]|nr:hypothetical protein [Lentisphaerales bacterium]
MRLLFALLFILSVHISAQELTSGVSGTGLGRGVSSLRILSSFKSFEQNGDEYLHYHQQQTFAYGVNSRLTLLGGFPLHIASGSRDYDGKLRLGGPTLMAKLRVFQLDKDSISTFRISLLMGVELPGVDNEISSDSIDPILGFGATSIQGRNGINFSSKLKFNTGDTPYYEFNDDEYLETVFGYSWRLTPREWEDYTYASTYLFTEFIHSYDFSSEQSLIVSPGYLIEARDYAIEIAVEFPLFDYGSRHSRLEFGLKLGFRYLF